MRSPVEQVTFPWSRREFLRGLATVGGVGLLGLRPKAAVAEPPPEITTIRIVHNEDIPSLCYGPQYVAEQLLRTEGFEKIEYISWPIAADAEAVAKGVVDIGAAWAGDLVIQADRRDSIVVLSGMHTGCAAVFAGGRVRAFRDLAGKKIAVTAQHDVSHVFFSLILAYIGLDPWQDVQWVALPYDKWGPALDEGEVDAIILWPPDVQVFREKNIGHVIWNMVDRPWSQYFCCMVTANRSFVNNNPVATKRALRAMLKATDICALDPERAARTVVENEFPVSYKRALQVFLEIPYGEWREYDPIDTLRFYTIRLHQVGMIEQTPEALIANSADWRFLNELKQELKA